MTKIDKLSFVVIESMWNIPEYCSTRWLET